MRSSLLRASLLLAVPFVVGAQTISGKLLQMSGRDTVAVETYTRTPTQLSSVIKMPGRSATITATLRADASVESLDLTLSEGTRSQSGTFLFRGDSVVLTGDGATRTVAGKAGAVASFPASFALFELALLRANKIGGASPVVPLFRLGQERIVYGTATKIGADSVALSVDGTAPLRFKVDANGLIVGGTSGNTGAYIVRAP